jgi:hypothetical protein
VAVVEVQLLQQEMRLAQAAALLEEMVVPLVLMEEMVVQLHLLYQALVVEVAEVAEVVVHLQRLDPLAASEQMEQLEVTVKLLFSGLNEKIQLLSSFTFDCRPESIHNSHIIYINGGCQCLNM